MTNQAETFVNQRAFALVPASLYDGKTTYQSSYNTFSISPQSGVIPPLQKQSIKIEFSPHMSCKDFVLAWLALFLLMIAQWQQIKFDSALGRHAAEVLRYLTILKWNPHMVIEWDP